MGNFFAHEEATHRMAMPSPVVSQPMQESPTCPRLSYREQKSLFGTMSTTVSDEATTGTQCTKANQKHAKTKNMPKPKRQFGHFECQKCHKKWTSSRAFQGLWQECTKCHNKVRPSNLQDIAPNYEHTYKCQNDKCKATSIVCGQLREELKGVIDISHEFTCAHNTSFTINRFPSKCFFYHPCTIQLCANCNCNKCANEHTAQNFIECNKLHQLTHPCRVCKSWCKLDKVQKIKVDMAVPHKQELCEMCNRLGKPCGK